MYMCTQPITISHHRDSGTRTRAPFTPPASCLLLPASRARQRSTRQLESRLVRCELMQWCRGADREPSRMSRVKRRTLCSVHVASDSERDGPCLCYMDNIDRPYALYGPSVPDSSSSSSFVGTFAVTMRWGAKWFVWGLASTYSPEGQGPRALKPH